MATDSSYGNWSPRSSALSGDGDNNNPPAQRTPWAQVVRGEQEAVSAAPSSSPPPPSVATVEEATFPDSSASMVIRRDNSDDNNSNVDHPKKPAWNKPLNGVVPIGPLIGGAVSWPPLSESTRPPPKSTSDSSKHSSVITTQGPVISHSPQNQKHTNTNSSPEFSPNHTMPVRHRSSRRGGVGGGAGVGSVQSGYTRPPLPPPLPPPFPSVDLSYGSLVVTPTPDSSLREHPYRGYTWEERPFGGFVPQSHSVNYQSSHRRGNFGGRFQGDGLHHNSHHRSGRDQHRDWNASRSSNARGVHVPQQAAASPRGLIRPPPPPLGSIPFITPPHAVRPFGNPLGFDLTLPFPYVPTLPPEAYSEVPFTAHGPPPPPPPPPPPALPLPMFFPGLDPPLPTLLVHQIDYYFSDANLVKDSYLRSRMDDEGWVPISLIAGFPRIQQLTRNIQLILDSLRASSVVEVQHNKVRRRNEWRKWIATYGRFATNSGLQSPVGSTYNAIATSLQKITFDEATANQSGTKDETDSSIEITPHSNS